MPDDEAKLIIRAQALGIDDLKTLREELARNQEIVARAANAVRASGGANDVAAKAIRAHTGTIQLLNKEIQIE